MKTEGITTRLLAATVILEKIALAIRDGHDVQVLDALTDIIQLVLTPILVEPNEAAVLREMVVLQGRLAAGERDGRRSI
jgi:hypothetical protein